MIRVHRSIVNKNWWNWNHHPKTVALIFVPSAFLFYSLFNMAFHNQPSSSVVGLCLTREKLASDSVISNDEQRSRLYDKMERDLDENGPAFLKQGETSQSLSLSDIFTLKDGYVTPILKAANPPVRANVLYLSTEYSVRISNAVYQQLSFVSSLVIAMGSHLSSFVGYLQKGEAVKHIFNPYFDKAIWFQNSSMYHFSMFHASHHITPVPATEDEIEVEASAVHAVADDLCPLKIVLDRVVLTSTGVLLGCWQVISGTDPITIRAKLRTALPRAPEKQLYDAAILHTSFARLLGHPTATPMELHKTSDEVQFFHDLVAKLNNQIRGMEAVVSELWYVEEYDVLALALDGRTKIRRFQLGCSRT